MRLSDPLEPVELQLVELWNRILAGLLGFRHEGHITAILQLGNFIVEVSLHRHVVWRGQLKGGTVGVEKSSRLLVQSFGKGLSQHRR